VPRTHEATKVIVGLMFGEERSSLMTDGTKQAGQRKLITTASDCDHLALSEVDDAVRDHLCLRWRAKPTIVLRVAHLRVRSRQARIGWTGCEGSGP